MVLQKKFFNNKRLIIIFLGGLLGLISFIACYDLDVLNVTNDTWLLASERDLRAHYIGWEFFRRSDWHFPIGMMDGIIYPRLVSIIYTDSIPLWAVFFKLFRAFLPETFQYFGIWGLYCFILQGVCASYIISKYNKNIVFNLIAAEFFILSPTLIQRLYFHSELSAHFLILLAFIIWLDREKFNTWKKKCIAWSILLVISAGTHIYFIPIIVIIMTSSLLYEAIEQKKVLKPLITWLIPILAAFIVLLLLGAFASKRALGSEGGLGFYGANLNALINSQEWAGIIPSLPLATIGQYEGYAYLGLGIFILILICVGRIFYRKEIKKYFQNRAFNISIIFCLIAALLCAWSPTITLGDKTLFEIPYPSFITDIFDMFRATGRFMWIVVYLIIIFLFIYIAKWITTLKSPKTVIINGIVAVCLLLQIVDLYPILSLRYDVGNEDNYDSKDYNALQSPIWDKIADKYDHIEMMEEEMLVHTNYKDSFSLAQYAVTHGMTISNFAAARPNVELRKEILEKNFNLLENNQADDRTIYVFGNAFSILGKNLNLNMYIIDNIIIGVKDEIDGFTEEDNVKKYDNNIYQSDLSNNIFSIPDDVENENGEITNNGDKAEYILYGPYLSIGEGVYDITFDVKVLEGNGDIGHVDIVANEGASVYSYKNITASDTEIVLNNVCIPSVDDLEIRIFMNEGAIIRVSGITCKLLGKDLIKNNPAFENNQLAYNLMDDHFIVSSSGYKDTETGYVINDGKTESDLIYGPYISAPPGRYTLTWEYETKDPSDEPIGYVDVCSNGGETIIARQEVAADSNGEVTINFELEDVVWDLELRFHVYSNENVIVKNVQMEVLN